VYVLANCVCEIYRGETDNEFGDPVPNNGPSGLVAEDVKANIEEARSRVWDPGTSTPRVVRTHVGRVQSTVDVKIQDRVHDVMHDEWFTVINVTRNHAVGRTPDTVLELERVTTRGTGNT
jgi:hypothetical protein